MENQPDIAYEIWGPDAERREWQIVVDRRVLGKHHSQLDAIQYALQLARETWEEGSLSTVVIRCRANGKPQRIASFG